MEVFRQFNGRKNVFTLWGRKFWNRIWSYSRERRNLGLVGLAFYPGSATSYGQASWCRVYYARALGNIWSVLLYTVNLSHSTVAVRMHVYGASCLFHPDKLCTSRVARLSNVVNWPIGQFTLVKFGPSVRYIALNTVIFVQDGEVWRMSLHDILIHFSVFVLVYNITSFCFHLRKISIELENWSK